MARYRSWPAVSQIWALIVLESTWMDLVANSTPMVDLESRFELVARESAQQVGLSDARVTDQDDCDTEMTPVSLARDLGRASDRTGSRTLEEELDGRRLARSGGGLPSGTGGGVTHIVLVVGHCSGEALGSRGTRRSRSLAVLVRVPEVAVLGEAVLIKRWELGASWTLRGMNATRRV